MRTFKRRLALVLIAALLLQLVPAVSFAATTKDLVDTTYGSFNGEGVWITEIYNNDVDRSEKNDTRPDDGFEPVQMFASASDLMEYIEIVSTHDEDIKLNDLYEVYLDGTLMPVTDMAGGTDITLTKGQPVVLWNYRTDIVMPTEAQLRSELRIDEKAMVLKLNYGANWAAASGTFVIRDKRTGADVSAFTAIKDTHTKDGYAVELRVPTLKSSAMEVYRALVLPTPGRVYARQVNGMILADTPSTFDGKGLYVTEILPDDIDRSATYGVTTNLMECFEVTNTTDEPVDLNSDYRLVYTVKEGSRKILSFNKYSSTASGHVGSASGCIVPAGGTAVLWSYREANITGYTKFPTLSQFRAAYGIGSDVPVYIFTNQNGLNDVQRAIEIFKPDGSDGLGELVSSYTWLGTECTEGRSVHLQINPEGPAMLVCSADAAPTLGTVDAAQCSFTLDNGGAIVVRPYEDDTVPTSIMQGEDLWLWFYYNTPGLARTEYGTYYRFDGEGEWIKSPEGGARVPHRYEAIISGAQLYDHDYVEFYVMISNLYRDTVRGIYRVDIQKLHEVDGIRTNIRSGQQVSGKVSVTANDGGTNSATKIYIDGVQQTVKPMLEDGAYLSYSVEGIDNSFRTAITTNKDKIIHKIGSWAFECLDDQIRHIDSSYFSYKSSTDSYDVTLRFWAGNYGTTAEDTMFPTANRDDWTLTKVQLRLPNGHDYLPTKVGPSSYNGVDTSAKVNTSTALDAVHQVGDSAGKSPYVAFTFSIPASEANAVGLTLDTTTLSDGAHTLKVVSGTVSQEIPFIVDNTAPQIGLGVAEGQSLTGKLTFDPQITDSNGLAAYTAKLDGEEIALPYETTAYALGEGSHTLWVQARDAAGNESEAQATFYVTDVSMDLTQMGSTDISHTGAKLYLTAESASATKVTFCQAQLIGAADIQTGTTDGLLPHIRYTIDVGDAAADDEVLVGWNGTASGIDDTHAANMFVLNTATGGWELIGTANAAGDIKDAVFPVRDHVAEGIATVVVQCTADSALPDLDTASDGKVGNNANWDGNTVPEDYDFSFAWITDTQYYVQKYNHHFIDQNNWIVDNADSWKIEYVIHTGDIVDDWNAEYQWQNADLAMKIFDDAGMPYGVLAGNHDVASCLDIEDYYYRYFPESRVKDQPTYGGSYRNNYGHYDLVSENGQDFIIVYMSWGIYEEEVAWMNEVLAKHADRKAILCFHGYTHYKESEDGLLDYFGVMIRDHVVAKNPNVFAVLNGHYSGATYQTARFDDNGDGKLDRTVYQICTDYQSVTEGGLEYIKFLYFDLDNDKIFVNSYSPYLDDFNYYDPTEVDDLQALAAATTDGKYYEMDVDAVTLGVDFSTDPQTLLGSHFTAQVLTDRVLGTATLDAATGSTEAVVSGLEPQTRYHWYALLENENTGVLRSEVLSFTTGAHTYGAVVTPPTCTEEGYTTYTCGCGDSYQGDVVTATGHSYVDGICAVCGVDDPDAVTDPGLALSYPTLSFEDEIIYNVYFSVSDMTSVVEMGLMILSSRDDSATMDDALYLVPGYVTNGTVYLAKSEGIPAANMGDALYFKVYAKLTDGSYAYSGAGGYNAKAYANSILSGDNSSEMKALVVSMLNYGAEAQLYFGHNTDKLVNSALTAEQQALVDAYDSAMMDAIVKADSTKTADFVRVSSNFKQLYPSVSFDGAFAINFYCQSAITVDSGMTLYYWDMETMAEVEKLSIDNATGSMEMVATGDVYWGQVPGIAAKEMDKTWYVTCVFESGGETITTGVISYSLGTYCQSKAAADGDAQQAFAQATAVYGYYAKQYFASIA